MIKAISGFQPFKGLQSNNRQPRKSFINISQPQADTVQFSGYGRRPSRPVHPDLTNYANMLEEKIAQVSHDEALNLRHIIDELKSGEFTGTLVGNRDKKRYVDIDFIDGQKYRAHSYNEDGSQVIIEYKESKESGIVSSAYNNKKMLTLKSVRYPKGEFNLKNDALYTTASFNHTDGLLSIDKAFEPDGKVRYQAQRYDLPASSFPPELGLQGRVHCYECTVDGRHKSSVLTDNKNKILATLHFRDDKTLDFAKIMNPEKSTVKRVLEYDDAGIKVVGDYSPEE